MTEPIFIQKLKRLGELTGYVSLNYNPAYYTWSVYDQRSKMHTYLETYEDLLADLDRRIADAEDGV